MPRLVHLYIRQCLIGFALSAGFVAVLLWLDVARLWTLASHDPAGILAIVVLWVLNGVVFAGVQFGISVQRLGRDEAPPASGRRRPVGPLLHAVSVVRARR